MKSISQVNTNHPYSLRSRNELCCRNPKTVKYGTETISSILYLRTEDRPLVPEIIKRRKTLDIFKNKVRKWKPGCYPCKTYLQHVSFI